MKALEKAIHGNKVLIFLDLESTQLSHEMIEIGAYSVLLHDDFTVKNINQGFTTYVKAHNPIGPIVKEITGISEKTLQDKGVIFPKAWQDFHHYVSKYHGRCSYLTFGNQDLRIIGQSVYLNGDAGKDFAHEISRNYLDFSSFISAYIKDEKNNPMSLTNYLKLFKVPFKGQAHDALADAYNLIDLYSAFLAQPDLVAHEYEKNLARLSHLPSPIAQVIRNLNNGHDVSVEEWKKAIQGALK